MEDLKIRQKTEDMIKYGYICLRQFPKSEKHTLGAQIKHCMINLLRLIIACNKKYSKRMAMQEIDVELDILRAYVRLSHELGFLPLRKYENWAKMNDEIGRMLGGWMKSLKR